VIKAVAATGGVIGVSLHGFMNWDGNPANPPTLDPLWRDVSRGVHRRDGELLILLDVDRVLAIGGNR
jgi:hypothetical protein